MLVVHVLDSSMDAMKIEIYLEYWQQDHPFKEKNMYDQEEEEMNTEFLCGTQFSRAITYVLRI
jgi:hypothetical protein